MNDPLDAVFVTDKDEAAELKRTDMARKLATCLERIPAELRGLFLEQFQHISSAELAQLRADLQAAQERSAEQARRLDAARYCITRRLRYHQNYPPVSSARWTDRENGVAGEDARDCDCDYCIEDRAWLAANPAPQVEQP